MRFPLMLRKTHENIVRRYVEKVEKEQAKTDACVLAAVDLIVDRAKETIAGLKESTEEDVAAEVIEQLSDTAGEFYRGLLENARLLTVDQVRQEATRMVAEQCYQVRQDATRMAAEQCERIVEQFKKTLLTEKRRRPAKKAAKKIRR